MRLSVFLFIVIVFLPKVTLATEDTNRKIVMIISATYVERGEFESAEKKLKKHLKEDSSDADAWNLLGQISLKGNNAKLAVNYFSRASKLAVENKKRRYHLNLAEAYLALGNKDLADRARELAMTFPESEGESDTDELLTDESKHAKDEQEAQSLKNSLSLTLGAGFDTNIGYLPDSDALVTGVAKPESAFGLLGISAERRRLSREKAWTTVADLQWVGVENQDLKDRGLLSLTLKSGTQLLVRSKPQYFNEVFVAGTGAFASQEGMAHRASIAQLGLKWGHANSLRDIYLSARVQGDDFPALKGTFIDPSGVTLETGLGYRTQKRKFNYSLEVLTALNNAKGESYRNRRIQIPLVLIHEPSEGFSYGLQAFHSREVFEKTSLVEYRAENRLGLFMTYRLSPLLVTGMQVEASITESNQAYFAYKREAATVYLKYGM